MRWPHHQSIYYGVNSKFIRMKFLRKILLVGLLPGFLISQAQNVQNKEDVPLDLGYRVLPTGDYNGSAYTISGKQLRNLPVTNLSAVLAGLVRLFCPTSARWWISE